MNIAFILSTGRTGTQFFESYLTQTCEKTICLHEPKPSRIFRIYSNLFLNSHISEDFICKQFFGARKKYEKKLQKKQYVESNNFMFGCIRALNSQIKNIRIIHIVRNPISYIRSHLNHKFWEGHKKLFAKFVPFWLEIEPLKKKEKKDPIIILAHRWHYINKTIGQLKLSNNYICIKFEDIFSKNINIANNNLNKIREFLSCSPLSAKENAIWLKRPKNASKYFQTRYIISPDHVKYINSGFGPMLKEYGYYPLTFEE